MHVYSRCGKSRGINGWHGRWRSGARVETRAAFICVVGAAGKGVYTNGAGGGKPGVESCMGAAGAVRPGAYTSVTGKGGVAARMCRGIAGSVGAGAYTSGPCKGQQLHGSKHL